MFLGKAFVSFRESNNCLNDLWKHSDLDVCLPCSPFNLSAFAAGLFRWIYLFALFCLNGSHIEVYSLLGSIDT